MEGSSATNQGDRGHDEGESLSPCTFHLILKCTSRNITVENSLVLSSPPKTVLDIEQQIEAQLSIPVFTQHLTYESTLLKDSDELDSLHIRSGDTLTVTYLSEARCDHLKAILEWMQELLGLLQQDEDLSTTSDEAYTHIILGYQAGVMEDLAFRKFSPWDSPVTQVNKLFFLQIGGMEVLLQLYSLIQNQPWASSPIELKYMEHTCMSVISNLASSLELRKMIIRCGVVPMCLLSLLHVKLKLGVAVEDDSGGESSQDNNNILHDVIASVIAILANICELPEVHPQIASKPEALHQLLCVGHSPSFEVLWSQLTATVFLCLAHSPSVHRSIAKPEILEGLLEACSIRKSWGVDVMDARLLEYFTLMVFAQLALMSPDLIPSNMQGRILHRMDSLMKAVSPLEMRQFEEKRRFSWSVFLPYVKLAYIPGICVEEPSHPSHSQIHKLQLVAEELALFWLCNTLGRECHREVIVEEGLVDYIICLPWHVPLSLGHRASAVAALVHAVVPDHKKVPKLSTLAKAKLAKVQFGLERVMRANSVNELLL